MSIDLDGFAQRAAERLGRDPTLHRAPGRVNLIGEHTDYNEGYVLPLPIGRQCVVAVSPRSDRRIEIWSENAAGEIGWDLDAGSPPRSGDWSDYVVGVIAQIEKRGGEIPGLDLGVASDVPLGGGLSSSAALEVAVALAVLGECSMNLPPTEVALLCQAAENEFVGTPCGVMDQMAAAYARTGAALWLDCRSLETRQVPLPEGAAVVACNTMVRHALADGEYAARRAQCEAGVRTLRESMPDVASLRDVTPEILQDAGSDLEDVVHRRCRHVVTENLRVTALVRALEASDLTSIGLLMSESHLSLARDYEVSCSELDVMVEIAQDAPGSIGARMTGGGFGGSTVHLVHRDRLEEFSDHMRTIFAARTGTTPDVIPCL